MDEAGQRAEGLAHYELNSVRITHLKTLYDQKFESLNEALKVALASNDRRLDAMNEFRQSLDDQTNKMMTRVEAIAAVQNVEAKATVEIASLREKVEQASKPNYVFVASAMSVIFALVAGVWIVIGLKIDTSVSPLSSTVEAISTRQVSGLERVKALELLIPQRVNERVIETSALRTDMATMQERMAHIIKEQDRERK